MPKLLIESHNGELTVKVEGIQGPGCEEWIRQIKEKLQGTVLEEAYTDEYYESLPDQLPVYE